MYVPHRVHCPTYGMRVEWMPWAVGKYRLTQRYAWSPARWAKRLSWKEVAGAFRTAWDTVFRSVKRAVAWRHEHQDLSGIEAIGIDKVRPTEAKALKEKGCEPVLTKTRRLLLERPENLSEKQKGLLSELGSVQPQVGAKLPVEGRVPVLPDLRLALLGGTIPQQVVHEDHAIEE